MRIVSGLQSSGRLHLGNWFGAVRQLVRYQESGDAFDFIADLHALTTVRDGERARALTFETAAGLLARGSIRPGLRSSGKATCRRCSSCTGSSGPSCPSRTWSAHTPTRKSWRAAWPQTSGSSPTRC
jgi:hypothetical protein